MNTENCADMTINERVKYFRKSVLHMNQTDFSLKLGMKQTGVSYMERNGSTVTEQTIKALNLIFNLSEDWLRYGIEPMYLDSDTFSLDDFAKKNGATELDLKVVRAYFEIDPNVRKTLLEAFKECFVEPAGISPYDDAPDTPEELERLFPPIEDDDLEVG